MGIYIKAKGSMANQITRLFRDSTACGSEYKEVKEKFWGSSTEKIFNEILLTVEKIGKCNVVTSDTSKDEPFSDHGVDQDLKKTILLCACLYWRVVNKRWTGK